MLMSHGGGGLLCNVRGGSPQEHHLPVEEAPPGYGKTDGNDPGG